MAKACCLSVFYHRAKAAVQNIKTPSRSQFYRISHHFSERRPFKGLKGSGGLCCFVHKFPNYKRLLRRTEASVLLVITVFSMFMGGV